MSAAAETTPRPPLTVPDYMRPLWNAWTAREQACHGCGAHLDRYAQTQGFHYCSATCRQAHS